MFYKKKGFPNEGEVILCTVKKILPTTVFVSLDEYRQREGIIHISEIAPGRIRTIRDYVKEGKKILCKVLRINLERQNIDLSLRRVTKSAQIHKNQAIKLEQKAEKVLEIFAQQSKKTIEDAYKSIGFKIIDEYGSLHDCFEEVLRNGEGVLISLSIDKTLAKKLTKLIQVRMQPPEVKITRKVSLKSKASEGVEVIKRSIKKALALAEAKKYATTVKYSGAPLYSITIKAADYKSAEKQMEEVVSIMITALEKEGGEGEELRKK